MGYTKRTTAVRTGHLEEPILQHRPGISPPHLQMVYFKKYVGTLNKLKEQMGRRV